MSPLPFAITGRGLLVTVVGLYLVSAIGLFAVDLQPAIPWSYMFMFFFGFIPLSWTLFRLLDGAEQEFPPDDWTLPPLAIVAGVAISLVYRPTHEWFLIACVPPLLYSLYSLYRATSTTRWQMVTAALTLLIGYGAVWNVNYTLCALLHDRTYDAWMLDFDRQLLGMLSGSTPEVAGLYPLITTKWLWYPLENCYAIVFVELFVVMFVMWRTGRNVSEFLAAVFATYFLAAAVFSCFPVIGGSTFYPETVRSELQGTLTDVMFQAMLRDLNAVRDRAPLDGAAYFVGLPSLHVALSVLMQWYLRSRRFVFWAFLPINGMMLASTWLLGWHYLADVVTGVLVVPIALWILSQINAIVARWSATPFDTEPTISV